MAKLMMTKIVVADPERCASFYVAVCGFDVAERITGEGFAEIILRRADGFGGTLVLLFNGTAPPPGEAVLVFETDDLPTFTAAVVKAGGIMTQAALKLPSLGLSFAMYCDPEGHVVEAISRE